MTNSCAIRKTDWLAVAILLGATACAGVSAQPLNNGDNQTDSKFDYDDKSTVSTIPFEPMDQQALSSTAIEGGLTTPAEGVPTKPVNQRAVEYYLDPLALQPDDNHTDLGRHEIPVEIQFSSPKNIPGQTFGSDYVIRPPQPRNIEGLNTSVQGRP